MRLRSKLHRKGGMIMSAPLKDNKCIVAIFDSYAKTVMRNECRNAADEEKRKQKREDVGTEKMQYLFEMQIQEDIYPSEHLVLKSANYICVITSEHLYNAMLELSEKQREVLILDFWYGYTDVEIASHFRVTSRTIRNWRKKAFTAIRCYYERGSCEKE